MAKKRYDKEYKVQAVKLIKEIGMTKASKELEVSANTMRGWIMAARQGQLDLGEGSYTPKGALSLAEEIAILRKQNVLTPKSWTV
jgi:transposase